MTTKTKKNKINPNKDYYPFIPKGLDDVGAALNIILRAIRIEIEQKKRESKHIKFLDVGCGYGNIVNFVQGYATRRNEHSNTKIQVLTNGIEYNSEIIPRNDNGRDFLYEYTHIDTLKYKDYKNFDIIYYFCPISTKKLQTKLERYIEKEMKVGAYLIAFLKQDEEIHTSPNFINIGKFTEARTGHALFLKIAE